MTLRGVRTRQWKWWLLLYAAVHLVISIGVIVAAKTGVEALQSVTRVRTSGFGGDEDQLDRLTACCRFRLLDWEVRSTARWAVPELFVPLDPDIRTIDRFFELSRGIRRAEFDALRGGPASRTAFLRSERDLIRLRAERAIAALVSEALAAEGLAERLRNNGPLMPPVAFTLVRPPSVLVVSPRDTIRLERTTLLQPDLHDEEASHLEFGAESLGWSSLVEPTGGYSTYPTIVSDRSDRDFAFSAVAHEWTHTYLFFHPLGLNYFESPQMRVINETAADIVGRVIAQRVLQQHFGVAPPEALEGRGEEPEEQRFNFRREMRETRIETERLLQEGAVDAAEFYMESRRRFFVENGYNIRRLNQAYFAFHGTYADSPGSINPVGPQLAALFEKAGSLRAFIQALKRVGTFQDYQHLLDAYEVGR